LGYGNEGDSWLNAIAAERIWQVGEYIRSRSVGFPLYELMISPLVHYGGWYLSNLLSVISGISCIIALFYLSDQGELYHPLFVICSIAFLPLFITNSSSTIDYIPALSFLIWAYVAVINDRYSLAAVLVGIACGFRLTSALYIIPCIIYCFKRTGSLLITFRMGAMATFTGILAFSPALFKFGIKYPYGPISYGYILAIVFGTYYLLSLFGVIQTLIIFTIIIYLFIYAIKTNSVYLHSADCLFHLTVIVVWIALFWLLPHKPEYLLPMVPSIILLIDKLSSNKYCIVVLLLLLSYNFISFDVVGGESGSRNISPSIKIGYTINRIQNRIFQLSIRKIATEFVTDRPTVLMLGASWIAGVNNKWIYDEKYKMYRQKDGNLFVSGRIRDERKLRELTSQGFRLVVWNKEKWEYFRTKNQFWRNYVEIVYELKEFFNLPINSEVETVK